ncbi:MAG TPA: metal ABC transporter ATP-binding protein [Candidatus Saccharimonadales bacterium]|nr:metal ABC transporter ATP-binding protein [Candidatus Saccharimonadales bacterium]
MNAAPALELLHVGARAGRHVLLEDVSLAVQPGSLLGLIGPNGGGKTTLLRVALGLRRPDSGTVRWFGMSLGQARQHGLRVGYVPQRGAWDPRFPLTVEETVLLGRRGLRPAGAPYTAADRAAARASLEFMDIQHLARQRLAACSGGELQRALVARALCVDPRVLVLDEATSAADAAAQDRFYRRLRELKARGVTVVLVSHDVGVIASVADEVACLNQRLHFHGAAPEALEPENLAGAYGCELELLAHGRVPHRVVRDHAAGPEPGAEREGER